MAPFKQYESIEQYTEPWLNDWLRRYPAIADEPMAVTEKIDGTNFQMIFVPDGVPTFASRKGIIGDRDKGFDFFNAQSAVCDGCADLLDRLQRYVNRSGETVNLYGELFGGKIQNRIDYGSDIRYCVFDVAVNGEYVPWDDTRNFILANHLGIYTVPYLGFYSLQVALEYGIAQPSLFSPSLGLCEGVVIRPMRHDFYKVFPDHKERFMVKRKNKDFTEIGTRKTVKPEPEVSPEVAALQDEYRAYFTRNRLLSAISKLGELNSVKQMGAFLKELTTDAKTDFLKTHELAKDDVKAVLRIGAEAARTVITQYLQGASQ